MITKRRYSNVLGSPCAQIGFNAFIVNDVNGIGNLNISRKLRITRSLLRVPGACSCDHALVRDRRCWRAAPSDITFV